MTSKKEYYLKRTRAFAKEIELGVPEEDRSRKDINIDALFPLVISYVGDLSYKIYNTEAVIGEKDNSFLVFAATFFSSYVVFNSSENLSLRYLVVGAVACYLCNKLGDASLLVSKIDIADCYNKPLLYSLVKVLKNDYNFDDLSNVNRFDYKEILSDYLINYSFSIKHGIAIAPIFSEKLKKRIYLCGSDDELFFLDLLLALCKTKCNYSVEAMLKNHNHFSYEKKRLLINNSFLSEFWPAQRLMLEKDFFNGKSGVIQLPTGAGKTKSISLCVYSYFSSFEKNISVIVSPFKALCRETSYTLKKDLSFDKSISVVELTDLMKSDYRLPQSDHIEIKSVIVVTPEKFLYVLRHEPSFAACIGQIIFDEGHLFEDDYRGAKYELLVASILLLTQELPQIIMISAIIAGVEKINQWISRGNGSVISCSSIATTDKYTASLTKRRSNNGIYYYLDYLNKDNFNEVDFYVPRFIEENKYRLKNRDKFFPIDKKDMSIAVMLRLAVYANCAIFSGTKKQVNSLAKRIIDISKFIDISSLSKRNDEVEQRKLCQQIQKNYGVNSIYYQSSKLGVFLHHSGISDGIRASIEYAMSIKKISNVICTSTLSQGVNLPINYLIIDSIYQGKEAIKKQDYRNLIGRVGRSGMYTEGTVIYSDYESYQEKSRRWKKFTKLYDSSNEDCYSQLLWVCGIYKGIDLSNLVKKFYLLEKKEEQLLFDKTLIGVDESEELIENIKNVLSDLESFISQWGNVDNSIVNELIEKTLLAQCEDSDCRQRLKDVFILINDYLNKKFAHTDIRLSYSKSLLSTEDYLQLVNDVNSFIKLRNFSENNIHIWCLKLIYRYSNNKAVSRFDFESIRAISELWVKGISYGEILEYCESINLKVGPKSRKVTIEDISSLCDSGFNYSATLILNTVYEEILYYSHWFRDVADCVSAYVLNLKYGLPDLISINLYEMGLNDRCLVQEIRDNLPIFRYSVEQLVNTLRYTKDSHYVILSKYPQYYLKQFNQIIS